MRCIDSCGGKDGVFVRGYHMDATTVSSNYWRCHTWEGHLLKNRATRKKGAGPREERGGKRELIRNQENDAIAVFNVLFRINGGARGFEECEQLVFVGPHRC